MVDEAPKGPGLISNITDIAILAGAIGGGVLIYNYLSKQTQPPSTGGEITLGELTLVIT